MRKKWGIIALVIALVLSLCTGVCGCFDGCSSSKPDDPGYVTPSEPDEPDDPDENVKIKLTEIPNADNVKIVADEIRAYLNAATVAEQIAALPAAKLTADKGALPVTFGWKGNGSVKYTLSLSDNAAFENAQTYVLSGMQNSIDVYNLLPSTTYYWKVSGDKQGDESLSSSFTTETLSARLIHADGTSNVRDIGGWAVGNAKVNYGKIYRGNQLNGYGNWGDNKLTEDGLKTFAEDLKIKTEIDLRRQGKDDADQTANFVCATNPYYKLTIGQYTDIFEQSVWENLPNDGKTVANTKENTADARRIAYVTGNAIRNENETKRSIRTLFGVLADESNYPVYIHCNAGADRTGTIAFLINGLLGVSEADLIRDFELTSFSKVSGLRYRSELKDGAFTDIGVMKNDYDNLVAFGALINAIKENYGAEGKPLSYAIESFLTDYIGVSHADVESVKRIMLSTYAESDVSYVGGERQVIEIGKADNAITLGDMAYTSVEKISLNGKDLGASLTAINGESLADVYGERELTVTVNIGDGKKTVKVPVLVVTKYIYTAEDLKAALAVNDKRNYGYYELKNDLTLDAFNNALTARFSGKNGFCGVFEGNNHTITSVLGNHGVFGYVSGGAEIRNLKFVAGGGTNEAGKSVLGDYIVDSLITNVEISVADGVIAMGADGIGLVTSNTFKGNAVSGLVVNAANAELNSLFGCSEKYAFAGNTFTDCVVNAKRVKELARYYSNGNYIPVYLEDARGFEGTITDVTEITVADIVNVKDSYVEIGVGERYAATTVTEIVCNGITVTEYKFENGVLRMFNDKAVFGENLGKTTLNVTFTGVNGIVFKTKINAVVFTDAASVTLDGMQEIVVDRPVNSVDLKEYAGATVYSITCNDYYFGDDAGALNIGDEFISNAFVHGVSSLNVLLEKDGNFYTVKIPVTIITDEITDAAQLNELLKSDKPEYAVYGYYKLVNDIGDAKNAFNNGNDVNWQNVDGLYGFRGTLDGNGHAVTGTVYSKGLFGLVGKGAYVKDLTVNAYGFANERTVLARSIRSATFENVTLNILSGESDRYYTEGGVITSLMSHSTTYKNVVINSLGKIDTLFGCSYWNYDHRKANTFENCSVNVKSVGGLLCVRKEVPDSLMSVTGVEGLTVSYVRSYDDAANVITIGNASAPITLGDDNADVTEITSIKLGDKTITYTFENGALTVTGGFEPSDFGKRTLVITGKVDDKSLTLTLSVSVVLPAETVTIGGVSEIVLTDAAEYTFDLGEYSGAEVIGATLGGENVTYGGGKLTLNEAFKQKTQKHGVQSLVVTVKKGDKYYNVTATVRVITKEIATLDELNAALQAGSDSAVYGYYRLTADIDSSKTWIDNSSYGAEWQNTESKFGFRGTFDGNGKSITSEISQFGLFGLIGKGAEIKNLTVNVKGYNNSRSALARSISEATIENVTINVISLGKGAVLSTAKEGGVISTVFSRLTVYKNVTINAADKDIDLLFGMSWGKYDANRANTFIDCVINAKSIAGLINAGNDTKPIVVPATGIDGLQITLFRADTAAENAFEIGKDLVVALGTDLVEITAITLGGNAFTAFGFENGNLTVLANAFGVTDVGLNKLDITAKIADGCAVKFSLTVEVVLTAEPVALDGIREVVLTDAAEYSLDLGEYSTLTALGATLGNENATYSNGKLTLTDAYKQNLQKHGNTVLTATFEKGGKYYKVTVNALVITQEIKTVAEMRTVSENTYGYYRLANNLTVTGDNVIELPDAVKNWQNADGQSGFRGTFDGNNKTITGWTRYNGLLGVVGKGAVIKDLTYVLTAYESGGSVFGRSITGATVENIVLEVRVVKDNVAFNKNGGLITTLLSHETTYKNVTINAADKDIDSLFGTSWGNYDANRANTFIDCFINAKSIAGLINAGNESNPVVVPATGISGLTVNTPAA